MNLQKTRVYLVRHGKTIYSHEERYFGQKDIPMSQEGINQINALAKRLAGLEFAAIFSSDLQRARMSAEIIANKSGSEIIIEPGFKEMNLGDWEGLTYNDISRISPELAKEWMDNTAYFKFPHGESLFELKERVITALDSLIVKYKGDSILVVSHGGPIRVLLCEALKLNLVHFLRIGQDYSALNIIDYYDDFAVCHLMNDLCHQLYF